MRALKYSLIGLLTIVFSACSSNLIYYRITALKEGLPVFCYSYESEKCIKDSAIPSFLTIREFSEDPFTICKTADDYNNANKIVWMLNNTNREKWVGNKIEYGVVPEGAQELVKVAPLKNNLYYEVANTLYFIKTSFGQYYVSTSFENLPTKKNLKDPSFLAKSKDKYIVDCDNKTWLAWFNRSVYTFSKDQLKNPMCSV